MVQLRSIYNSDVGHLGFIVCLRIFAWDFADSSKDILASKSHCSSWDICMHVETRHFLIFKNILETTTNFRNHRDYFQNISKFFKIICFPLIYIFFWVMLMFGDTWNKKLSGWLYFFKFFMYVCDIKPEYQQKAHYVSDLSKLDALFNKKHSNVLLILRHKGSTCIGP